jgi:regulator of sirC expression with transglutaminase-like and TPR domain
MKLDSCLDLISKNSSKKALNMCSKIVEKFPNYPEPLVDRSLIYTLLGEEKLACKDIKSAMSLINDKSIEIDPLIKYQVQVRYNSCKKL